MSQILENKISRNPGLKEVILYFRQRQEGFAIIWILALIIAFAAFGSVIVATYNVSLFGQLDATLSSQAESLAEYMGAIQNQMDDIMGSLWACDDIRRSKRALASGRVMLRVEADAEGMVAQVSVLENTTKDSVLAYCAVRKLLDIRLPKALRKFESFKMPIMYGPETDGLRQTDKQETGDKKSTAKEDVQDGR